MVFHEVNNYFNFNGHQLCGNYIISLSLQKYECHKVLCVHYTVLYKVHNYLCLNV